MHHQSRTSTFTLYVVCVIAALCVQVEAGCNANLSGLQDCGYVGINSQQCTSKGCCWYQQPSGSNEPWCFFQNTPSNTSVCRPDGLRSDCGQYSEDDCTSAGCCWDPVSPNPQNLPWCYFHNPVSPGYKVLNMTSTAYGLTGYLGVLAGDTTSYGPDITTLVFDIYFETQERVRVRITDAAEARYEVPQSVIPRKTYTTAASVQDYSVGLSQNPFGFWVVRKSDNNVLFNSTIQSIQDFNGLIFKDQYIEISTWMPTNPTLYGLGESTKTDGFALDTNSHTYTLFNRDTPCSVGNQNLYGSHPFYLEMRSNGNAHGVLMMNSNGMDVVIRPQSLTYRMNGGIIDLYVFTGGSKPDMVVQQYTELVGRPYFPPYWSLGFHQSKYGYKSVWELEQVVANYSAANIPLETMWSDIDYMDAYQDFTLDPVNYPKAEMNSFVSNLHDNNQHYVVILDPGIHVNSELPSYQKLMQSGAYIKDASGNPFQGCVWPGSTNFPDFLNPAAQDYWTSEVSDFYDLLPVDGLWIDMNEISNAFCDGECPTSQCFPPGSSKQLAGTPSTIIPHSDEALPSANGRRDSSTFNPTNPPYNIDNGGSDQPLNVKTLDMDATHYNNEVEYNVHNLYGLTEAIATHKALQSVIKNPDGSLVRPFLLSRSTFVSSGHWTAHWQGDNASVWPDIWYSILNMLNMNIYGVPMIGADICGFNGNTTEELCARWILVGAFSPFCRDHSSIGTISQELYRWPQVAANGRFILSVRYSLLPYYYTLLYRAYDQGSTVIRSLFFEFPTDTKAWGIDQQFMVGDALLVTPVIQQGADSVRGYFPAGKWYSLFDYSEIIQNSVGSTVSLNAPIDTIPVHILGGSVLPTQTPAYTIVETRSNPYTLIVALDVHNSASGSLYIDDGSSQDAMTQDYTLISYAASSSTLKANVAGKTHSTSSKQTLGAIQVIGVSKKPSTVTFNDQAADFRYNTTSQLVTVESIDFPMNKGFTLNWQ